MENATRILEYMEYLEENAAPAINDRAFIKNAKPDELSTFLGILAKKKVPISEMPDWIIHINDAIKTDVDMNDFFRAMQEADYPDQLGEFVWKNANQEKYLALYPDDDQYAKAVNESANDIELAINEFKQRYGKYLDSETLEAALSEMSKAKSAWDVRDIASIFTNLNFYRFKDTDEIVGHGGIKPAKTVGGNDSKSRTIRFLGDREYENNEPATYFDKSLAQPYINKILDESANPLKDAADEHKKKQKGLSPYGSFNPDAGDVETNVAFFNRANSCTSISSGECMAEGIEENQNGNNNNMGNINIRTALNEIDKSLEQPCFIAMYDAANLSEEDKLSLANMLVSDNKDINDIYNFLFDKQESSDEHIIRYKGKLIEYDFYNQGEYTVQYQGDDVWFDTLDAAKKFIDELRTSNEGLTEAKETDDKIIYSCVIDTAEASSCLDLLKPGDTVVVAEDTLYTYYDDFMEYSSEEELKQLGFEVKGDEIIIPRGTKMKYVEKSRGGEYGLEFDINGINLWFYGLLVNGMKISSKRFEQYCVQNQYGLDDTLYSYLKSTKQLDDYIKYIMKR